MSRFIEGLDGRQVQLLPSSLEDYIAADNPVRVVDAFIDGLDLAEVGFQGVVPEVTGRPAYHPATLLKIYLYGYLNRIPSSRRLERETQRNLEMIWLTGDLQPDFKTIADFRRDNGVPIQATCRQFVLLCRQIGLFTSGAVAIDGSKWDAEKHGRTPRQRRKLHLAIDVETGEIVAHILTDPDVGDIAAVPSLLARVEGSIASVIGDGAYDGMSVSERHPCASATRRPTSSSRRG